jgi:hypothetical protein
MNNVLKHHISLKHEVGSTAHARIKSTFTLLGTQEGQRRFGSTQIHSFIHHASKVNTKAVSCVHRIRCITLFSNKQNQESKKADKIWYQLPTI